ncbi:MAG TPA: YaaR family protein [Desulfuromonadales bacterium]|nr:YaaR family protein [Desulfuromonadales bacterium]
MRIEDSSSLRELEKNTKGSSPVKKMLTSLFDTEVAHKVSSIVSYQDDVDTLRREIETVGEKLSREPTLANFKQFRELLSSLAKRISTEAYRLEKFGGTPQNPRYYEVISVIDREADKLYELIVRENRDHIAITDKIIGIKGLVVDLVT